MDGETSHRTNKRNKEMTTLGVTSEIASRKETSGKFPAGSDCGTAQLHFPYQQKTIKSFNAKPCLKQRQQLSGKPQGWSPVQLCPVRFGIDAR